MGHGKLLIKLVVCWFESMWESSIKMGSATSKEALSVLWVGAFSKCAPDWKKKISCHL